MSDINPILPEERRRQIRERLTKYGSVTAANLAQEWVLSEDTIRRDLRVLADRGHCQRVQGGALPLEAAPSTGPSAGLSAGPLGERLTQGGERKERLARRALSLVEPGMLIFIDAGSTNAAFARLLPEGQDLTVATNAPDIAMTLMGRLGVEVLLIGGVLDPHTGACLGPDAIKALGTLHLDLYVMGGCAVTETGRVSVHHHGEALFKRAVAEGSPQVLCMATNDKLHGLARFHVLDPSGRMTLVVEPSADPLLVRTCAEKGVLVLGQQTGLGGLS